MKAIQSGKLRLNLGFQSSEGHHRNPKTKMAKSVCALEGQRRWVLTGTPIVSGYLVVADCLRLLCTFQINSPKVHTANICMSATKLCSGPWLHPQIPSAVQPAGSG
jgi:hypothetical protein